MDDEGHIYASVRSVMAPGGTPNPTKFVHQSTRIDGQHLRMDRARMAAQATSPEPLMSLDGDSARWSSVPGETGNPWELSVSGQRMHWREEGLFELSGPLLGCGFQWYLPGVDWGTFYVSQLYDVSGKCEGRQVKGVVAIDQPFMAPGGAIHHSKDLVVNNKKHVIWWTFATIYADGRFDAGAFMVGHDFLGYAILMNEKGEVRTTSDIEGRVRHKRDSYFAESVRVTLDGNEEWEFMPDVKGEMVDFIGGFPITAQQQGYWHRVGDTRRPDRWLGWGETDRRNGTARNVPGSELPLHR